MSTEAQLEDVRLAVFDVDHTLVDGATGMYFAYHMAKNGHIAWTRLAVGGWWVLAHKFGFMDVGATMQGAAADFEGMSRAFIEECTQASFDRYVKPRLFPRARPLVERYREAGIRTLLLSASGDTMVRLLADELGVDDAIANRLEMDGDTATGKLLEPYAYGEGKRVYLEEYLRGQDIAPAECAAFADSQSDLPLLTFVGYPHAVNPDRTLRRAARERGWPIISLH